MERCRPALIALIALSAAGCFSDRGIAIEVDVGTTGATSVELYVGNSACADHRDAVIRCDGGIAPPMASAHLAGAVWFRDDLAPYRAPVVDHKATFRLQADADTTLPIVIAVGSGGDPATPIATATLTEVEVLAKSARVITTKLVTAGPVPQNAGDDRVQVWTQPAGDRSSCVVVEHWADGKATRNFIVPARDPDCDSAKAPECDPAAADAVLTTNGIDKPPACFVSSTDSASQACRLGAFGCTDAGGQDDPNALCLTTRDDVCVPEAFCECRGKQLDASCTGPKLEGNMDGVPHLVCTVRLLDNEVACPDTSEMIDLKGHLGADRCKQPMLSPFDLMNLGSQGPSHSFGGVDLQLTRHSNDCPFQVQVNRDSTHAPEPPELGMMTLGNDQHAVLVPIILQFKRVVACIPLTAPLDPPMCTFIEAPADPMWTCVP